MNTGTMKNEYCVAGVENMGNSVDMINIDILSANTDGESVNSTASATTNDLCKSRSLGGLGKMKFVAIISCTRDYVALEKSLDMVVGDNVKRVFLFGGNAPKRYEIPPRILELQELLTESGDGAFFYNADAPETLVKVDAYLKGIGADVWFFLNAGDTIQELYTSYLESFFGYNKGKCGVVFTPVLTDGITANLVKDDPRLPVEFQDLPKDGLFSFAEDYERFPKGGDRVSLLDGTAVLAEDALAAGLDVEKGVDAFAKLVERAAPVKGSFGRLKMVYVGRTNRITTHAIVHSKNYLVSCIIPIYNVAECLEEAIESVVNQTIGFKKNIELILVNDGSTDNSGVICEKYAEKYPDNIIYVSQDNSGLGAARNNGLSNAHGKYVSFLDSSDKFETDFFRVGIDFIGRNPRFNGYRQDKGNLIAKAYRRKECETEFEYLVSVIVPVYNVEGYLARCVDSLLEQTIEQDKMEIVLVNDGSPDNSWEICKKYAEKYSNVKAYIKGNGGLSNARNFGIRHSKGKYLMYLDSDDSLTPETVESIADFFDANYDAVDLVTYKDQPYANGEKLPLHFRYKSMDKTGIYDLKENVYTTQTRVNICVKNKSSDNVMFDETPCFRQEDQAYCLAVLKDKMKIGFVENAEYRYTTDNDTSIMAMHFTPIQIFETSMTFFEDLFAQYGEKVPQWVQTYFLHDCNWKLCQHKLFPYHYGKQEFESASNRIKALMTKIDISVILGHPQVDPYHKHFWVTMRNVKNTTVSVRPDEAAAFADGTKTMSCARFEVIVSRLEIRNDILDFCAYLKSPIFNYTPNMPNIWITERNDDREYSPIKMELYESADSWYHCRTKTNNFFGFRHRVRMGEKKSFKVFIEIDDMFYNTVFWFMPTVTINSSLKRYAFVRGKWLIQYRDSEFFISPLQSPETFELDMLNSMELSPEDFDLRKKVITYRKFAARVWLYFDMAHVGFDNAYWQFLHDIEKRDGVARYYVGDLTLAERIPSQYRDNLIEWGSYKHKELLLSAEKVLTAFLGENSIYPFGLTERRKFKDIMRFEIIYLQHGVLHASYRQMYSIDWNHCDKIVISTHFEKANFVNKYHWNEGDLIASGMARYDRIDKSKAPCNKILLAPSWRSYFASLSKESGWGVSSQKFLTSNYFKNIEAFLTSDELSETLNKYDMFLDVKLHPIAKSLSEHFTCLPERIRLIEGDAEIEEYSVFITDFSSFVFDFIYLERAIMYFVPDWEEFKCGMNAYRELDLPFEDAFGELSKTPEDAVKSLEKILKNDCVPEGIYAERMNGFFLPGDNHCERLYNELMSEAVIK